MNQQLETEQFLIATLIGYPESIYQADIQPSDMLYLPDYLTAVKELYFSTGTLNVTLLADAVIAANPARDLLATRKEIVTLLGCAMSKDPTGYVEWLKNAAQVRHIAEVAKSISMKALDSQAKASDLYTLINQASQGFEGKSVIQTQREVLQSWIDDQKKISYTPTGLRALDNAMDGGLYDGNVYGLAGYAKAGKTLLAGTISGNLSQAGVKHLYVAMEMGAGAIEARNVARQIGVKGGHLRRDIKSGNNPIKVEHLNDTTLYANCPGITWDELKQQLLIAIHKHKVKGFIIDYWQLINNPHHRVDNHQYWADVAQDISNMVKKHNVWCILIAQLNDDGKTLGSRGLVRACDMLLNIEMVNDMPDHRWLKMEATRYTAQRDLGSETIPYLQIMEEGPYMQDLPLI